MHFESRAGGGGGGGGGEDRGKQIASNLTEKNDGVAWKHAKSRILDADT